MQTTGDMHNPAGPPDDAPRRRRRGPARIVLRIAALYCLYAAAVFLAQRWLIFPAWIAPAPDSREKYNDATTVLTRDIGADRPVIAWFIPAPGGAADRPMPLVLYLHGNGEIIDTQARRIEGYLAGGVSVLIPEYRGYGRSGGAPGADAFIDDGLHFLRLTLQRQDVDPDRLVIHGRSMGGHVAVEIAARHAPRALILGSTFTSMRDLGSRKAFVPRFLIRHPMDTMAVLPSLDLPILMFHGAPAGIIPIDHSRRLQAAARRGRLVEIDCGHNNFPCDETERYWQTIRSLLTETGVTDRP